MTQSTINPAVPIPGQPLDAIVVQQNFAAAWSDINGILALPNVTPNAVIRGIYLTVDGGGSAITTGVKGYLYLPYACTINSWTLVADQTGSIVIDIWRAVYPTIPSSGNSIAGSQLPTLASQVNAQNATLNTWTVAVPAGSLFGFNVNSASTVTRANLTIAVTTT